VYFIVWQYSTTLVIISFGSYNTSVVSGKVGEEELVSFKRNCFHVFPYVIIK